MGEGGLKIKGQAEAERNREEGKGSQNGSVDDMVYQSHIDTLNGSLTSQSEIAHS